MTNRVDRLAENQFGAALDGLEENLAELRGGAPQYIGGASIQYFRSQTASTFDWSGHTSGVGSLGGQEFLVTATALNTNVFWGSLYDNLYADTSSTVYGGLQFCTDIQIGAFPVSSTYVDAPNASSTPNAKSWFVLISADVARSLWIKFYVLGIDQATVTVAAL